jgi:hypothetical protein
MGPADYQDTLLSKKCRTVGELNKRGCTLGEVIVVVQRPVKAHHSFIQLSVILVQNKNVIFQGLVMATVTQWVIY